VCVCVCVSNLLHVTEDVLPAVEHPFSLLGVQLVDEVSGEVLIGVLISETHTQTHTHTHYKRQQQLIEKPKRTEMLA